ncbi:MAG: NAD(P)-binding protein [Eubacteriaceae bacterium]|nr:NAD(P)-binding protein [Eubacteriaceae bacterium]
MRKEDAAIFTEKCIKGAPAACMDACPLMLDIRAFTALAEKGKWNAAYRVLRNATVFPAIASILCPSACETSCGRKQLGDDAVAIRLIEGACVQLAKNQKPQAFALPQKTGQIAVIGAGLAGLAAALCLAQKKYLVTVFDKNSGWGGSLRPHPRFAEINADIELQFATSDVDFRYNEEIASLGDLAGYDMVYIATGAGGNDFGLLPSWDPKLLATSAHNVFMGGSLTGMDVAAKIAQGKLFSKISDSFIQTGRALAASDDIDIGDAIYPLQADTPRAARIEPSMLSGYSEAEAKEEAARCMKCDCDNCFEQCEMLVLYRKKPKSIALEVYADSQAEPPMSSHTLTRQVYSCNICGNCKVSCPVDIDIGALLQFSRETRYEESIYIGALHDYWLREMDFSTGEASFYAAPKSGKTCRYIFFPGCQLGAHNPEHVIRSYEFLQDMDETGFFAGCCGAPAYWAGDKERMRENFERIRNVWHELDCAEFVFACATCESLFSQFLPEIPHVPLYELMANSYAISPGNIYEFASVFDPCSAYGNAAMESSVRAIAVQSGATLYELPEKNRCCGNGGHIRVADPGLYNTITRNRASMGEAPYIVYCSNCLDVFLSQNKDSVHILDIALNLPHQTVRSKIHERHENAINVKRRLIGNMNGEEFVPTTNEWDAIELVMSSTLADSIEEKLISHGDIKEAIWRAEATGDKLVDGFGVFRCSLEREVLTYWTAYKVMESGAFEVLEAYSHRMRFIRES